MAYSEEADEDFKLPLRPWLEKQINSRKFKGLEWESEGDSKQFRLPWIKKNLPNWEEYYKIFRAWAEHRGRGVVEMADDSKLKSNFRCALNKSVDFEEITSKSQLQKQTGNYKVYRILTPKEVRERKKKRSKIQTKQEQNFNSDEFKTIDKKGLDILDSMDAPSSGSHNGDISIEFLQQDVTSFPTADSSHHSPSFFVADGEMACAQMAVCPPEADEFSSVLAISPAENHTNQATWPNDVPMEDESSVVDAATKAKSLREEAESQSAKSLILQQLENGGIKPEKLCECQIIITYNGEKVLDKDFRRMDKGFRIFYGNQEEQIRLLQMRNTTDEKLSDFKLPGIQLPLLRQQSHTMSAILDKTDLGVIVRYDPQTLQICAKRLCQSQVFFFDPHDHSTNAAPKKLERDESVPLFSHEKYFMEYMQQFVSTHNDTPPEAEIVLAVGIKPKSKLGLPAMKGLKIELIPHALKVFMQSNKEHSNSISLCFSNPTSMENLLRQIHQSSSPTQNFLSVMH